MSEDDTPKRESLLDSMNETEANRRRLLKSSGGLATALAAIPGLSKVADAAGLQQRPDNAQLKAMADEFQRQPVVEQALRAQGSDLLEVLAERGILERPSFADFETGTIHSHSNPSKEDEGVIILSYDDTNGGTAQIQVLHQIPDGRLRFFVEPHADRSYAIVEYDNQPDKTIMADGSEVGIQKDCSTEWKSNGCNYDPSYDCACTEEDPCPCSDTEVRCCQRLGCSIVGYRYSTGCITAPEGCCTHYDCTRYC